MAYAYDKLEVRNCALPILRLLECVKINGTKKSYISKLENAKGNIQLSTLIRIFEQGLGRKIGLTFL